MKKKKRKDDDGSTTPLSEEESVPKVSSESERSQSDSEDTTGPEKAEDVEPSAIEDNQGDERKDDESPPEEPTIKEDEDKPEPKKLDPKYIGLIMVKRSPSFRQWRGNPLELDDPNEVVAVDPKDKRVVDMLRCGNVQFVGNKVRGTPRIVKLD